MEAKTKQRKELDTFHFLAQETVHIATLSVCHHGRERGRNLEQLSRALSLVMGATKEKIRSLPMD